MIINRENLADYHEGKQADDLQIHEVDQRERIIFDRKLFGQWMGFDGCLQVNVLLRAHLDKFLGASDDIKSPGMEEVDVGSEDEEGVLDDGLAEMWCVVRRAVAEHMQTSKDLAEKKRKRWVGL